MVKIGVCREFLKPKFFNHFFLNLVNISIFYVGFYALIGAYTWAIMAIFMQITKSGYPTRPKYTGTNSVLQNTIFSPGMGVRPHIGTTLSQISFSTQDPSLYTSFLDLYLKRKY